MILSVRIIWTRKMKTTHRSSKLRSILRPERPDISQKPNADDDLIVISDVSNGKYYYLSVVDNFRMDKYEYVLVEPSGVFDTDDFLDLIYDTPLDKWYRMGSIISI